MKGLYYWLININKLVSREEQGPTSGEVVLLSKMETSKNHRNFKGPFRKILKPVADLS
jgi:hypothetical protein